jgi:hypothetical protein
VIKHEEAKKARDLFSSFTFSARRRNEKVRIDKVSEENYSNEGA